MMKAAKSLVLSSSFIFIEGWIEGGGKRSGPGRRRRHLIDMFGIGEEEYHHAIQCFLGLVGNARETPFHPWAAISEIEKKTKNAAASPFSHVPLITVCYSIKREPPMRFFCLPFGFFRFNWSRR